MSKRAKNRQRKDLRFLNWFINRGHLPLDPTDAELRRFLRQKSYRRKL